MDSDMRRAAQRLATGINVQLPIIKHNGTPRINLSNVWDRMPLSGWAKNSTESQRIQSEQEMAKLNGTKYEGRLPGDFTGQTFMIDKPVLKIYLKRLEKIIKKKHKGQINDNMTEEEILALIDNDETVASGLPEPPHSNDQAAMMSGALGSAEGDAPITESPPPDKDEPSVDFVGVKDQAKKNEQPNVKTRSASKGKPKRKRKDDSDGGDGDDDDEWKADGRKKPSRKKKRADKHDPAFARQERRLNKMQLSIRDFITEGVKNANQNDRASEHTLRGDDPIMDYEKDGFTLRPHQLDAIGRYEYLIEKYHAVLLADDMGLGKTAIVIGHLQREVNKARAENRLVIYAIVAPRSLISNWMHELSHSSLRYCDYSQHTKLSAAELEARYDVLIIPYNSICIPFRNMNKTWAHWEAAKEGMSEHLREQIVEANFDTKFVDRGRVELPLAGVRFDEVIVEEGHHIKDPWTELAQSLQLLSTEKRVAITGTPLQNDIPEFGAMLQFLNLQPYCDPSLFRATFMGKKTKHVSAKIRRRNRLNDAILGAIRSAITIRRTKDQEFNGEPILAIPGSRAVFCEVDMSQAERQYQLQTKDIWNPLWRSRKMKARENAKDKDKHKHDLPHRAEGDVLPMINRCRQHAVHKILVDVDFGDEVDIDPAMLNGQSVDGKDLTPKKPSKKKTVATSKKASAQAEADRKRFTHYLHGDPDAWKSDRTLAVVQQVEAVLAEHAEGAEQCAPGSERNIYRSEHKILVFSEFLGALDILEVGLRSKGIKTSRFDGRMTPAERDTIRHRFEETGKNFKDSNTQPDDISVMLISNKTGFEGLNLIHASDVFIVAPTWNPSVEDQLLGRAARTGQKNKVTVWRFYAMDSIERHILALQNVKRIRVDNVLDDEFVRNNQNDITKCSDAVMDILGHERCMTAILQGGMVMD